MTALTAIVASHLLPLLLQLALLLALSCCRAAVPSQSSQSPQLPKVCGHYVGCMQGRYMPGYRTARFEAFLGIPYALPPVGELRFSNPKSHPRWWGVLDATEPRTDCIQKNYLVPNPTVFGVEDCLYLNVYRPAVRTEQRLPVMVYIHGGGWFSGNAGPQVHGPEYLMDTQAVILVTFAYRLGPFGFLSTDDANMPGNFGLKDQNLALRWVQRNIGAFGGDPQQVTVFGQSAGATSAHMHMLSKQSEGLFRSIIALSGTANVPFAITEEPLVQARTMAALCNVSHAHELSTAKLTRALRAVDAVALVNAGDGLKYWHVDHMTNFRPVVEKADAKDAFLTQHPRQLLAEGKYKPVPWMVGVVPQEGAVRVLAILANEALKAEFNENFDELLEKLLDLPTPIHREQRTVVMHQVIDEYFKGVHEINDATAQGFLDCISDRGFHQPFYNAIAHYVHTVDTDLYPVYLYKFNYEGPYSYASIYTGGQPLRDYGVVHCDDLIYTFRAPLLFPDFEKNSTHAAVSAAFVANLVHFAQHGMPMDADKLRPCNEASFEFSGAEAMCDYQEFANAAHGAFEIRVNNKFQVGRARLWNRLLKLE